MARDIHKIDNYLIRLGWLVLAISLMAVTCAGGEKVYEVTRRAPDGRIEDVQTVRSSDDLRSVASSHPGAEVEVVEHFSIVRWAWVLGAITMLGVGYHLRRRENQALAAWNILERASEISADELAHTAGVTRERLHRVLVLINAQPGAHYVWDPGSNRIFDGRLAERVAQLDACSSCGARINQAVALHLASLPVCGYCGATARAEDVQRLRREALEQIRAGEPAPPRQFSVPIFILLLVFFWPAALVYALWKSGVLQTWFGPARA